MAKKLNMTQRWERDHPHDLCPSHPYLANHWRRARGIGESGKKKEMREKYEAALAEKRARESINSTEGNARQSLAD
jgi:hypothetical protein